MPFRVEEVEVTKGQGQLTCLNSFLVDLVLWDDFHLKRLVRDFGPCHVSILCVDRCGDDLKWCQMFYCPSISSRVFNIGCF